MLFENSVLLYQLPRITHYTGWLEADRAKLIIERVNEEIKSGFSEVQIENFMSVLKSFSQKF